MNESLIGNLVFGIIIIALVTFIVKYKFTAYLKNRTRKKRFARGHMLESKARAYLENIGYDVINEQNVHYHNYTVNGIDYQSKLILDYVVEKEGKTYIVEVKSGKKAISMSDRNSRRQILEYDFVIKNDGIFLLDMENKNMQLVTFYSKAERQDNIYRKIIIVLAFIGIFIPFWSVRILIGLTLIAIWKYPYKARKILDIFPSFRF